MAKKSKGNSAMTVSIDENWQAESDARTLVEAASIREDKTRLAAAIKFARIKEQQMKGIIQDGAAELLEDDDDGDE